MWYIFKEKQCVASCDCEPNHDDLMIRDEIAIQNDKVFDINKITIKDKSNIIKKELNEEDLITNNRMKRDKLLKESDWTQFDDSPLTDIQKQEWKIYRQALRDLMEIKPVTKQIFPIPPIK